MARAGERKPGALRGEPNGVNAAAWDGIWATDGEPNWAAKAAGEEGRGELPGIGTPAIVCGCRVKNGREKRLDL